MSSNRFFCWSNVIAIFAGRCETSIYELHLCVMRYLDEIHLGLAPQIRSSSIIAQHHLIASGAGVGVLHCFIGDADSLLVPVLGDQRVWLVIHKDTHSSWKGLADSHCNAPSPRVASRLT